MKKLLSVLFLLATCFVGLGASRIAVDVVVSSNPANNNTLIVNAVTRTWKTTVSTPATEILIGANAAESATNLYNHVVTYGFQGPVSVNRISNGIKLTGQVDQPMTVTQGGTWATITSQTLPVTTMYSVRVPFFGEPSSQRQYVANELALGMAAYATSRFPLGAELMANYFSKGTNVAVNTTLFTNNGAQWNMKDGAGDDFTILTAGQVLPKVFPIFDLTQFSTNGSVAKIKSGASITNAVLSGGADSSSGPLLVPLVPTAAAHATSKTYVDTQISLIDNSDSEWSITGNTGLASDGSNFAGTADNAPHFLKANSQTAAAFYPRSTSNPVIVFGKSQNTIDALSTSALVQGTDHANGNKVLGSSSDVLIGGSRASRIENTARGTIIGTDFGYLSGNNTVVFSGQETTNKANLSVAQGYQSIVDAGADNSWAIGRQSTVTHPNTFLWNDGSTPRASSATKTWEIWALNGVGINADPIFGGSGLTLQGEPTAATHAATKSYVDGRVLKSGDTMTGFLTLHSDPTSGLHAATKAYVDSQVGGGGTPSGPAGGELGGTYPNPTLLNASVIAKVLTGLSTGTGGNVSASDSILTAFGRLENRTALNDAKATGADRVLKSGDTMTGLLTLSADPLSALHAATKQYVDTYTNLATASAVGRSKLSVAPASASNPIAVGDNDPRMTDSRAPNGSASGELSGTYPGPSLVNSAVIGKVLTGLSTGSGGTVAATDTILQAFGKLENRTALNDAKVTGSDRVLKAGDTMTGLLTLSGDPTSALHAATKQYVDAGDGDLFSATADATVSNTTTETTIIGSGQGSLTLPANYFSAGKKLRFKLRGRVNTGNVAGRQFTVNVKLGGTTLLTTGLSTAPTSANNQVLEIEGEIVCRTTGGSGTVFALGQGIINQDSNGAVFYQMLNTATSTINTTTTQTFDITWTWDFAASTSTVTSNIVILEK